MKRIILNENGALVRVRLKNVTRIEIDDDHKKTTFYGEDDVIITINNDTVEDVWFIMEDNINDL